MGRTRRQNPDRDRDEGANMTRHSQRSSLMTPTLAIATTSPSAGPSIRERLNCVAFNAMALPIWSCLASDGAMV